MLDLSMPHLTVRNPVSTVDRALEGQLVVLMTKLAAASGGHPAHLARFLTTSTALDVAAQEMRTMMLFVSLDPPIASSTSSGNFA